MKQLAIISTLVLALCALAACGADDKSDARYRAEVAAAMHDSIADDIAALQQAARALQAAAPTPSGRGWDATQDAAAIAAMRDAWRRCRIAYEHFEGATAPIFPDLDHTLDARYDDFLSELGDAGDADAFDAKGATGMHAIERILWADAIPAPVVQFESTLPGYRIAAFPGTEAEAARFKTGLAQKLIDDADTLHAQWQPAAVDIGAAFQGLVSLMNEQKEKVNKAATGEEESRYAQMTLFDLRENLEGTRKVYEVFRPWIASKAGGADADTKIEAGFDGLAALYATHTGDALPPTPSDWSSDQPTAANLATPFGALWKSVHDAVDPAADGSVVFEMNRTAVLLGFPEFVEGS
jgi:iron uptake system component EfeO